jgi:hypothetical protein
VKKPDRNGGRSQNQRKRVPRFHMASSITLLLNGANPVV